MSRSVLWWPCASPRPAPKKNRCFWLAFVFIGCNYYLLLFITAAFTYSLMLVDLKLVIGLETTPYRSFKTNCQIDPPVSSKGSCLVISECTEESRNSICSFWISIWPCICCSVCRCSANCWSKELQCCCRSSKRRLRVLWLSLLSPEADRVPTPVLVDEPMSPQWTPR